MLKVTNRQEIPFSRAPPPEGEDRRAVEPPAPGLLYRNLSSGRQRRRGLGRSARRRSARPRSRGLLLRAPYARIRRSRTVRVFRMPSLPLPMRTPYRLTLPLVSRRNRNGVIKRALVDPRPFALRYGMDGRTIRAPVRGAARVHVSHAARSVRALRAVRAECDAFRGLALDAHVRQPGRCGRGSDAGDGGRLARTGRDDANRDGAERDRRRPFGKGRRR